MNNINTLTSIIIGLDRHGRLNNEDIETVILVLKERLNQLKVLEWTKEK